MSGSLKLALYIFAGVVAAYVALKLLMVIVGQVLALVIPLLILTGVVYVIYTVVSRKALGGGRRYLP